MIFDWPASLIPMDVQVRPPRKTVGLNTSISESSQVVPSIRPPFGMTIEFAELFGDEVLTYRVLLSLFEGRANWARIPLFDLWFQAKRRAFGGGYSTHSDGTAFSDGTRYLVDDISGVTVTGVQGDRMITADFGAYGTELLQGGLYFGLGDHPYIAQGVWWEGSVATIRTSPTLRDDYAAEELKLRPTMIAGLLTDDTGQLTLKKGRFGGPTLELEERFA